MTRYEQGFMNKCAEYGVDGRLVIQKLAQDAAAAAPAKDPNWVQRQYGAAKDWVKDPNNRTGVGAIGGAAAGAGIAALVEALRKRRNPNDRKDYLKAVLMGLAVGGAAGAAGGKWGPGLYEKAKPGAQAAWGYMKDIGSAFAGKGSNTAPLIEAARAAREAKKQAK